tara:strand:+ start:221 stop:412 length:192 start_codon:yes stop_codon:yes gene_type:complete
MPYQIKKVNGKYKLYNLKKKEFVKTNYKSKETAVKAGMNFMKYRKEKPVLVGNKLINKKDKKK